MRVESSLPSMTVNLNLASNFPGHHLYAVPMMPALNGVTSFVVVDKGQYHTNLLVRRLLLPADVLQVNKLSKLIFDTFEPQRLLPIVAPSQ